VTILIVAPVPSARKSFIALGMRRSVTLARFNAVQLGGMAQATVHEQERSGAAWTLEWLIVPQVVVATGASLRLASDLMTSLRQLGMASGEI
jgi:adenylosuccinate lyase